MIAPAVPLVGQLVVTQHARDRARTRFPGFKAARIVDEVRNAFTEGRVSPDPPTGCSPSRAMREISLYAWTPDSIRIYALRATSRSFHVTTTMAAGAHREGA